MDREGSSRCSKNSYKVMLKKRNKPHKETSRRTGEGCTWRWSAAQRVQVDRRPEHRGLTAGEESRQRSGAKHPACVFDSGSQAIAVVLLVLQPLFCIRGRRSGGYWPWPLGKAECNPWLSGCQGQGLYPPHCLSARGDEWKQMLFTCEQNPVLVRQQWKNLATVGGE